MTSKSEDFHKVKARKDKVLVNNMEKGERMIGSIIVRNDNARADGIRARWAQVYSIGEGVTDIKEGDWVLVEHGRWSRSLDFNEQFDEYSEEYVLHLIEYPKSVLLVSEEKPDAAAMGVA